MWTLTIPDWRPSQHLSLNGRRRISPWTIRQLQQAAKDRVIYAIRERPPAHAFARGQVEVQIRFGYKLRRRRDPDNLAGLSKPILDAIVAEGIIVDDDSEHIRLLVSAEIGLANYTRIDIAERWER